MTLAELIESLNHILTTTAEDSQTDFAIHQLIVRLTSDRPTFLYGDDFDRQHYPMTDWHLDIVEEIADILNLPAATEWHYLATIQGRCLSAELGEHQANRVRRLHADQIARLLDVVGFRWVGMRGNTIEVGIEHSEAAATQKHAAARGKGVTA